MLISPQHLQQADLYHERLLDRRLAALAPQTWGILSLEVDQGALAAGELRVSRFVGILPDGLYLDFAAGDPEAPAARPIGTHFAPSQPVLEVFLAVPKERDGVPASRPRAVRPRLRFAARDSSRPPGRWAISRGSRLTCPSRSPGATSRCCSATRPAMISIPSRSPRLFARQRLAACERSLHPVGADHPRLHRFCAAVCAACSRS